MNQAGKCPHVFCLCRTFDSAPTAVFRNSLEIVTSVFPPEPIKTSLLSETQQRNFTNHSKNGPFHLQTQSECPGCGQDRSKDPKFRIQDGVMQYELSLYWCPNYFSPERYQGTDSAAGGTRHVCCRNCLHVPLCEMKAMTRDFHRKNSVK